MKLIVVITLIAISNIVRSENSGQIDWRKITPTNDVQRLAKRAYMIEYRNKKTGGLVVKPGSQNGEIVYVNCQNKADPAWMNESIDYLTKYSKLKIRLTNGNFSIENPKIEGNLSLYIVDDPALPNLLIAPENRWAMVNVAPLYKGVKKAYFEARVKKELSRAFAALCGFCNSSYPNALTSGITKPEDLDKHADARLTVDVFRRFESYLLPFGITPAVILTYHQACQEGWAPAPTNEYQKAIWDRVHAAPKNPMKIEFDPKKGR